MQNATGSELAIPDDNGKQIVTPPKRVRDAAAAAAVAARLDYQDQVAADNRRSYNALINGEAPFSSEWLKRVGRADDTNVNFLGAQAKLKAAKAPYTNTLNGVRHIGTFDCDLDDPAECNWVERTLAEEFQWAHDEWDSSGHNGGFKTNMLRLQDRFVRDGVVAAMMPDCYDWRWGITQLGDMKFPRNTELGEQNIEILKTIKTVPVTTLWSWVEKNPHVWKKEAVLQAILSSANSDSELNRNGFYSADKFQELVKQNDIELGYNSFKPLTLTQMLVKEFNGCWSRYIFLQSNPAIGMLYEHHGYFKDVDDFLVMFYSDTGEGTYHSVRGMGWAMFTAEKALNIAKCDLLNAARLTGKLLVRPRDANTTEKMAAGVAVGSLMLFPYEAEIIPAQMPNAATQMLPIIGQLERDSQNNTGAYQARTITPDGQSRTATEAELQVSQESVLSNSQMNLYYPPLGRLLSLTWRRMMNPDYNQALPGGKIAMEMRRRLHKAGITERHLQSVQRVTATRMIGNGSEAQRDSILQRLLALSPSLDEEGARAARYEYVASLVGPREAAMYITPQEHRIPADEVYNAESENDSFVIGRPRQILGTDNHYIHAMTHLQFLAGYRDAAANGEMTMVQVIPAMNLGMVHTQQHWEVIAQDPARQPEAKEIRQGLSQLANFVQTNTEKLNRQMAEEGGQEMTGPSVTEQKLMERDALFQQQMEQKARMGELDRFNKMEFAKTQRAITDLNAANKFAQKNTELSTQRNLAQVNKNQG